jgi:hypothetical protein
MRNDFKQRPRPEFKGGGIALRGKGMHKMPNGKMMKNSDMKKK